MHNFNSKLIYHLHEHSINKQLVYHCWTNKHICKSFNNICKHYEWFGRLNIKSQIKPKRFDLQNITWLPSSYFHNLGARGVGKGVFNSFHLAWSVRKLYNLIHVNQILNLDISYWTHVKGLARIKLLVEHLKKNSKYKNYIKLSDKKIEHK